MEVLININLDNVNLAGDEDTPYNANELSYILDNLANEVECGLRLSTEYYYIIRDTNGNTVGKFELKHDHDPIGHKQWKDEEHE